MEKIPDNQKDPQDGMPDASASGMEPLSPSETDKQGEKFFSDQEVEELLGTSERSPGERKEDGEQGDGRHVDEGVSGVHTQQENTPENLPVTEEVKEVKPEKTRAERVAERQAEKYGIDESSAAKQLGKGFLKGAINTLGSVFGARAAWEVPKAVFGYFKKKGQRGNISETTLQLLRQAQDVSKSRPERSEGMEEIRQYNIEDEAHRVWEARGGGISTEEEMQRDLQQAKEIMSGRRRELKGNIFGDVLPVMQKIKELEARLKETKMPVAEKKALRTEMAHILKEYRREGKNLEEAQTERVGTLLDMYINNKTQATLAVKETLNTVVTVSFVPGMRAGVYAAFSAVERAQKAAEGYDKEHFRNKNGSWSEKFKSVAKNLFVDSVKETAKGLTLQIEGGGLAKAAQFGSSVGAVLRVAGLAEFEAAIYAGKITPQEGMQKFFDAAGNGDIKGVFAQAGENWVVNARRILSYAGIKFPEQQPSGASVQLHTDYQSFKESLDGPPPPTADGIAHGTEQEYLGRTITDQWKFMQEQGATAAGVGGLGASGMSNTAAVEFPGIADEKVTAALSSGKFGDADDIKNAVASAKAYGVVEEGKSIGETLHRGIPRDFTVTVINPDGSKIEKFDVNLVHKGDTVVMDDKGAITVYKTSDVAVRDGMSLEGEYSKIYKEFKLDEIPHDVREQFNKGHGFWGSKITRAEAGEIRAWWDTHKGEYARTHDALGKVYTPEQVEKIKIPGDANWPPSDGHTDAERIAPQPWSDQVRTGGEFQVDAAPGASLGDEFEETDAKQIPVAAEHSSAAEVSSEVGMPHRMESEHLTYGNAKEGNFDGRFLYDAKGNVSEFYHEGKTAVGGTVELQKLVLKDSWKEQVFNASTGRPSVIQHIETTAQTIGIEKRMLETMRDIGKEDTKEYEFLKEKVDDATKLLKKTYGDIIK